MPTQMAIDKLQEVQVHQWQKINEYHDVDISSIFAYIQIKLIFKLFTDDLQRFILQNASFGISKSVHNRLDIFDTRTIIRLHML